MKDIKDRARDYLRGQTQLNGGGLFHCNILNLVLGFAEQETKNLEEENAELKDKLDDAKEIIEQMTDLFFDCWQERGYKAMKFEERVNNFIKE